MICLTPDIRIFPYSAGRGISPMLTFPVIELDESTAAAAWPLVRMTAPELNPEQWRARAHAIRLRGGGILGVEVESGGLMGVATYEAVSNPHVGKVLEVHTLVCLELSRLAPVRRALRCVLDERAATFGCTAIALGPAARAFKPSPRLRRS
jgi:hypothetical protein